ncbi:MAG: single-stranded DNA-binding protein [Candidatus Sericytochromatia bacterium]|nr:single-stranded DNA-binding protein [Candidatus Sericytochromatia bacterium]
MAANNQVVLIGRAGNNVSDDVRHLQSGSMVAEVRLAVNRPGKDSMGNPVTDWISCQFWNKQGERLSEFVKKGDLISVTGSVRVDSWEQDGQKRQKYFIHGENFQMLESRRSRDERRESESFGGGDYGSSQSSYGGGYNNAAPQRQSAPAPQASAPSSDYNDEFALDDDELPPF